MRKSYFIVIFLSFFTFTFGQLSKTLNVTSAGSLSTLMSVSEANTVTNLTLTGNIDARDVAFLRDKMLLLSVLDMSGVTIKPYSGIQGTYTISTIVYPANELPLCSFYNAGTLLPKYSLSSIKLPNTLTSIGSSAFYYCSGLTGTFTLPALVTSIGDYALYGCTKLSSYVVETANSRYSSTDGILYNKLKDSLFVCPSAKAGSITIPSTVTYIGGSAFDGCSLLTGSLTLPTALKSIGAYAFYYCTGLTGSINIPATLTTLGEGAFYGCTGLSGVISFPKTLKTIGKYAFVDCNLISSFQVDAMNTKYTAVDGVLNTKLQDSLLVCPAAKAGVFTIPTTVKGIGTCAFYNCSGLTGVLTIPQSVGHIGDYAFYGCTSISAYNVSTLNAKYNSNDGVLLNKNQDSLLVCPSGKIGSYSVPSTVKNIGTYSFYYCTGLTGSITIPSSVKAIGDYAFYGCNQLSGFNVDAGNTVFSSVDGVLFNRMKDSIFICPVGKTGSYSIPNSVKVVDFYAFDGSKLTNIIIPNGVTTIGKYAFDYCTGLSEINLPKSIISVGSGAFYGCSNLLKIYSQNPSPVAVDYLTFGLINQTNCALIVLIGAKASYMNSDYWKLFTNVSESSFTSSQMASSSNNWFAYKQDNTIFVTGVEIGSLVELFTVNGIIIHSNKAQQSNVAIDVARGGSYVIKINGKVQKLVL